MSNLLVKIGELNSLNNLSEMFSYIYIVSVCRLTGAVFYVKGENLRGSLSRFRSYQPQLMDVFKSLNICSHPTEYWVLSVSFSHYFSLSLVFVIIRMLFFPQNSRDNTVPHLDLLVLGT